MPEISRFFGVIVYMYARDHLPPHFHAAYNDEEAMISIETGNVRAIYPVSKHDSYRHGSNSTGRN